MAQDTEEPLQGVDAGLIQWSYFVLPVRFTVNGVDMLKSDLPVGRVTDEDKAWLALPLIDLALVGNGRVQQLKHGSAVSYDLPDIGMQMQFERNGDIVVVTTPGWAESSCTYSELSSAFSAFSNEVRRFILGAAPSLANHARWGVWLKEPPTTGGL